MGKNWTVGEETDVFSYLEKNKSKINVGDTIEYITNNQMGWKKYKVEEDESGKKKLKLISDYDSFLEEDDTRIGGKKRRKSSKKKSKTNKSRKNRKTKGKR